MDFQSIYIKIFWLRLIEWNTFTQNRMTTKVQYKVQGILKQQQNAMTSEVKSQGKFIFR